MNASRIFICHAIYPDNQRDAQILNYLIHTLQGAGIEVIIDSSSTEADFFQFLQQQLPACQAFILFQTTTALQSQQVDSALKFAQTLIDQKRIQQIFRFISSSNDRDVVPANWRTLTTFDGVRDYKRAVEKLLLATAAQPLVEAPLQTDLSISSAYKASSAYTTSDASVAPPPARMSFPKAPSKINYDRPPEPPSGFKKLLHQHQNKSSGTNRKRKLLIRILILLMVVTLVGVVSVAGFLLLNHRQPAAKPVTTMQAYFFSSNQMGTDNTTDGVCDELQLNLQNSTSPAAGNSYYAWLLPDSSNAEGATVALGKVLISNGAAHLTYADPKHRNLLLTESRFLITEESSNSSPTAPSPNKQTWRYYNAIPQTPNPQDPHHYSDLDHIRHLLGQEPLLLQFSMQGGLSTWFYQSMQQVFQLANTAQAALQQQENNTFNHNIVGILDYLDGAEHITGDVPSAMQQAANIQAPRIPLLTFDSMNQNPPGYIYHVQTHMQGITSSPGATDAQQTLAGKMDIELNKINAFLQQARQDAKKLVLLPNDQLTNLTTTTTMNDLMNTITAAFLGQLDTNTGTRQGGATWIHDVMPQLAMFNIQPYKPTSH